MPSLNKIILIGQLTANPDIKVTNDGVSFAKFTLAVDRPDQEKFGKQTDFFKIICWRNLADKLKDYQKGDFFLLEGQVNFNSFNNESGQKQWITEIEARELRPLMNLKDHNNQINQPVKAVDKTIKQQPILEMKKDQPEVDFDFNNSELNDVEAVPEFTLAADEDIPF